MSVNPGLPPEGVRIRAHVEKKIEGLRVALNLEANAPTARTATLVALGARINTLEELLRWLDGAGR